MSKNEGLLVVIAAPSGGGKGTIIKAYLEKHKETEYSISCTSRSTRHDDNPKSYHFITKEQFEDMIEKNEFFEYVEFCGNYYGTPKKFILDTINENKDIILELEYIGAVNVKKQYPKAVLIFLLPPTAHTLKTRLVNRGTETMDKINRRLNRAEEEVSNINEFDYLVINDNLEKAINDVESIIQHVKNRELRENSVFNVNTEENKKFTQCFLNELKEINNI